MGTSLHITHNALWVDRGEQALGVVLSKSVLVFSNYSHEMTAHVCDRVKKEYLVCVCASVRPSIQVLGKIPTISINKTDGCHVYLSKDSLACEIISAKSSEMNVLVPNADGEFVSLLLYTRYRLCRSLQLLYTQSVSSTSIHSVGLFNFYTLSLSLQLLYIQSQSVYSASIHSVCLSSLICSVLSQL